MPPDRLSARLPPMPSRRVVGLLALALLAAGLAGVVFTLDGPGTEPVPADRANETSQEPPTGDAGGGGFSDVNVFEGEYNTSGDWAVPLEPGRYENLTQEVVYLDSEADGVDLQLGILRPAAPGGQTFPAVVMASPYYPPLQTVDLRSFQAQGGFPIPWGEWFGQTWASRGFAVGFLALRGTADSGGCNDFWGPRVQADLDQAITWLAERPWSNGNVGMVGVSHSAGSAFAAASTGNPHLETIVPMSGWTDLFRFYVRNGTTLPGFPAMAEAQETLVRGAAQNNPTNGRTTSHTAEALCPTQFPLDVARSSYAATGERDPEGYYAERNHRPGILEAYEGSLLLAHGFDDLTIPPRQIHPFAHRLVEDEDVTVKRVLGHWGHCPPGFAPCNEHVRWDWAEILHRWLDHWLKEDETRNLGPRIQVMDTSGRWRQTDTWPPEDTSTSRLHLTPDGSLSPEPPNQTGSRRLVPDPTRTLPPAPGPMRELAEEAEQAAPPCEACVAALETEPYEEGLGFSGQPRIHVTVTPTGPGGHLAARLEVVDEGEARTVGRGAIDLHYADADGQRDPVVPGQTVLARLQLEPLDVAVPEGAHLRLVLHQGANAGGFPSVPSYPVELQLGGNQSVAKLDVHEPEPEAFFRPPGG